jgi:hypothetical protein
VGLANLGSELETCVGSRVHLVGVSISFEKNFYRLPFTPPSLVRHIDPSHSFVLQEPSPRCMANFESRRNSIPPAQSSSQPLLSPNMVDESVVPFTAEAFSFDPIEGDVPAIAASPKGAAPMEVAYAFDVPLASLPLVGNCGAKMGIEGSSEAKGIAVQPLAPVAPRTSRHSASPGKARKPRGCASSRYQRRPEVRP